MSLPSVAAPDTVKEETEHMFNPFLDRLRAEEVLPQRLAERVPVREIEEAQRHATDEELLLVNVLPEPPLLPSARQRDPAADVFSGYHEHGKAKQQNSAE